MDKENWVFIPIRPHLSPKENTMLKLFAVFAAALALAHISQHNTRAARAAGERYSPWSDWAFVALVVLLSLFSGLRTQYNDTQNYIAGFNRAQELSQWVAEPDHWNPFKNPLFGFYQSLLKTLFHNSQMLIMLSAVFTQVCFLRFFKRYSQNFTFSIFIYFTLGTYLFTLAAMKQVLGMAIVTLAFPYLEKKKWLPYYLIVAVAMLVHTYAMAFAILPLLRVKPWSLFTFLFLAVTVAVMLNFESAITAFMEQANDLGKTLADYEVFDDHTINLFRLAVYAVPPLLSLIFARWVLAGTGKMENVLIHMSIVSLAFMILGTQAGANMFGRMANYFELGTICCLPTMLKKTFDKPSYRLISAIACLCFMGFFLYANVFGGDFSQSYQSISIWQFLFS